MYWTKLKAGVWEKETQLKLLELSTGILSYSSFSRLSSFCLEQTHAKKAEIFLCDTKEKVSQETVSSLPPNRLKTKFQIPFT